MMKRHVVVALFFLIMGLGLPPLPAWAVELEPKEVAEIQSAVQLQINALSKDDAESAFALTTADTRTRFGSSDNFMRLIKEQYDPVYRHRLAMYSPPKVIDGKVYQVVRLTDFENHVWVAIYLMLKDNDGTWKIDGCELVETTTVSI